MRRSFSNVRTRMERLESHLQRSTEAGCQACQGKEANIQVVVTYWG